jgi:hypothetical protein
MTGLESCEEHDAAAVRRIEADDAVFVYPDGSLGDKAQDIKTWKRVRLGRLVRRGHKVGVLDGDSAVSAAADR